MPLIKGKSKKAMSENIKTEMDSGKPQKQSIAIAYSMAKKASKNKMAKGGMAGCYADGGNVTHDGINSSNDDIENIKKGVKAVGSALGFSEGGVVANETDEHADEMSAEYDDLVLDDNLNPDLAHEYAMSDSDVGGSEEESRREDMVSRIMKSQRLKDKLPKVR